VSDVRAFDTEKFMEHVQVVWESRGMSARDAAKAAGVSASTISRGSPSLQCAAALSSWSGLSLDKYVLGAALLDSEGG
jgi:Trp operon repressor